MPATPWEKALEHGRKWVKRGITYSFTPNEARVLRIFFTNLSRNTFFLRCFPANVQATLSSMYSRMKNPRGLRGVFVDNFLPLFLASLLNEVEVGGEEAFLRRNKIRNLDTFIAHSYRTQEKFEEFIAKMAVDPEYFELFSSAEKAKQFLKMFLDRFGHNSIARTATAAVCLEDISIDAASFVTDARPGSGFIELSTRYVDVSKHGRYPIYEELKLYDGRAAAAADEYISESFAAYRYLIGNNFDGPFPDFLRTKYKGLFKQTKDAEVGIQGESCDALGNLLLTSTLTSVCAVMSGEALPTLVRHLLLANRPETIALAEAIVAEAKGGGAGQFLANADRYTPSANDIAGYRHLDVQKFVGDMAPRIHGLSTEDLLKLLTLKEGLAECESVESALALLYPDGRQQFDKLPREFETTITVRGTMSFRGWRDDHRQSLATHGRTRVTPHLGFYQYPKPHPAEMQSTFAEIAEQGRKVYAMLANVPVELKEYVLPMGFLVGYTFSANWREWEFCGWQRTKSTVNDEVRQQFLAADRLLGERFPWWKAAARADRTEHYLFARGQAIELP
ncbi:MAG: FAD-dependent thymidylate synthase [Patescibacteria group bacterium]|nr:FAD-dependent thymidylate synthase [Patescibacteria group bacterium]